jgi:integral membrane protein
VASTLTNRYAWFSDREAWNIFRLAAFGEAFGWTLLISGITYQHFDLPNAHDVLKILGQTHGTFFFGYIAALLAVAVSLRLSRVQFIIAAAFSIPPYGTLVYEKYLAHKRFHSAAKNHREIIVRAIIVDGKKLLAVQPKKGTFWCLPGGKVEANESSETALIRLITKQLGTKPKLGDLIKTYEYLHRDQLRLECSTL